MEWSKEVNLPIVVHSRDASQDTFDLIEKVNPIGSDSLLLRQCRNGKEYVKRFLYRSGRNVTFKNAKKLIEVVNEIPLSSILIESMPLI